MSQIKLNTTLKAALSGLALLSLPQVIFAQEADSNVKRMDNIVVTASGSEQLIEDAPASITVVSRQDLEKKSFNDITDMLRDVPGVSITGGGSRSDISVRGMSPQYTLILIDGKRQSSRETRPNSDGPGIEQGWMPPLEAIERIEVVRGPMSSLYGSEAMGGVINVITRKVPEKWSGSLRGEATIQEDRDSGDIFGGNFFLGGPLIDKTLGLQIYGKKQYRQEDDIIGGFNRQDTTSGTAKLSLKAGDDHDFGLEMSRTLQDRDSMTGKSTAEVDPRNGRRYEDSKSRYSRNNYSLSHNGRWSDIFSTDSYVQYDETENPGRSMKLRNTEAETKGNLLLGSHALTFGAMYQYESLGDQGNQYDKSLDKITRYQWALFAEDEWSITDNFSLTGGARMTHDENYGSHWTPRAYAVWHIVPELTLKGGVSWGFKAPGLRQSVGGWGQITGGGGVPAIIMGNPDLQPEKSVSEEIGFIWNPMAEISTSLTFFNTDYKDKISEVRRCQDKKNLPTCHVEPGDKGYKFISDRVNVDKAVMRGVEATANFQIYDEWSLKTNYTYTYSRQKSGINSGRPLNKNPRHMVNASLDYDPREDLNLWTRVNFRSRTSEYLSRTTMSDATPSFTFVDLGVNYKISKNFDVGLGVYNVFDKRVTSEDFDAVYDGRRYWAQVTAKF
ncbi:ligand-gated channel protein [Brackiella oedipodis]|uniref:ligand-gated channel protein n=1 Tax=Brackiella oedipodis TaxID=124225 RepID=UPI00048E46CF|nr:ligand-gated channel protein [Brackiella oedipodis]